MLTFSSFVLLVSSVQASSPNLFASQATQPNELLGMELGAHRALVATDKLGRFAFIVTPILGGDYKEWVTPVAFVSAVGATVLMVLKVFILKKKFVSKLVTNLIVAAAAFINGYFSAQTAAAAYVASDKLDFLLWLKEELAFNIVRIAAATGNAIALVFALVGYNFYVTYILAVASYAATTFGNWEAIKNLFSSLTSPSTL